MSAREIGPVLTAEELRRGFDAAFSERPAAQDAEVASFLALRVGADAYALRIEEVRGFVAARKIVALPSPAYGLLGLAGIRGAVVPVFSLPVLMGYARGEDRPRWFVLCGGAAPIALAFDDFDGYLEVPASDVRPVGEPGRAYVREILRTGGAPRGIIALAQLTTTIEASAASATGATTARPVKER